jgi:drug/metabolite transporter (DMT)-like permease
MFLAAYSALFWAEKSIPSGVASVLVATIPVWTALFEIFLFKKARMRPSLAVAICLGLAGVAILSFSNNLGNAHLIACLAILGAEICWSFGTVLSKSMKLPSVKTLSAGGQMMLGGILLLVCSLAAGEMHPFPTLSVRAVSALAYLIVAGSLLAYTAYVWLLARMPATKVASYAYVNPVIALGFGFWFGGEALTARTLIGASLVLAGVLLLLRDGPTGHECETEG